MATRGEAFFSTFWPVYKDFQKKQAELLNRWLYLPEALAEKRKAGIKEALSLLAEQKALQQEAEYRKAQIQNMMETLRLRKEQERRRWFNLLQSRGGKPKQADPLRIENTIRGLKAINPDLVPIADKMQKIYLTTDSADAVLDYLNSLRVEPYERKRLFGKPIKMYRIQDPTMEEPIELDAQQYSQLINMISLFNLLQQSQTPYGGSSTIRTYGTETIPTTGTWQPTSMTIKTTPETMSKYQQVLNLIQQGASGDDNAWTTLLNMANTDPEIKKILEQLGESLEQ